MATYDDDICAWTQEQAELAAECPYSFDQILGSGNEDWFPTAR